MLSRTQQKLLRKLGSKKYRHQYKMFVAEGRKVLSDLLREGLSLEFLICTEGSDFEKMGTTVTAEVLKEWSNLETPDEVLAVFRFPEIGNPYSSLLLILDGVKDPGNLGTILRTCDWFGVTHVYCTSGTVDYYNPKVVQSTMGSIGRIQIHNLNQEQILEELQQRGFHFICAEMDGVPVGEFESTAPIALVMGSESHGPSDFWKKNAQAITIPRKGNSKVESLNVGVAAAILISALSR